MHHRYVIALAAILYCLVNISDGLSSAEDILANKCPSSVVVPSHHSSRKVNWTPPHVQDRTGKLKHIKVHPPNAIPPFKAPLGNTLIKYTLALGNGQETSCSFNITVFKGLSFQEKPPSQYAFFEPAHFSVPCKAKGGHHISYKWLFNDSPLQYDGHRSWQGNYLRMSGLLRKHSGTYTCVAFTTGERSSKISAKAVVKIRDKFLKRPGKKNIAITEGSSLRLPCHVSHNNDNIDYSWLFNGFPIKYDNHTEWRESQHELVLKSVQLKHSGTYKCQVTTYMPNQKLSMIVHVTIREGLSFQEKPPSQYAFFEPAHFSVPCKAKGGHHISYKWLFKDSPLQYDGYRSWQGNYLHMNGLLRKHSGTYTCVAFTTGERSSKISAKTVVKIRDKFLKRPDKKNITITEGSSLRLPCHVSHNNDNIDYSWLFNGFPIKYDNHTEWRESQHELVLKSVQLKHSGTYKCQVTTYMPNQKLSMVVHVKIREGLSFQEKPPSHYAFVEGANFSVPCKAKGGHHISYKWLFNDSPLQYDGHRSWQGNYLHMDGLLRKHSGTYTCVAFTTGERSSKISAKTVVKIREGLSFQEKPPSHYAFVEGANFSVPCKAKGGHHISYKWLFNDSPLQYDDYRSWQDNYLHMSGLLRKHSGTYTCVAFTTGERSSKISAKTVVKIRAARYSFTAWSAWTKCLPSQSGSTRGHRSRTRTCVTSARIEAPGKCSGKTKQFETCHIKVSTLPPPTETPSPITRKETVILPVTRPVKGKEGAIVAKRKESTASKSKSKFLDTFYGKLALGSSLGIIFVILGCAVFLLVGHRKEKKDKRRRKGYRPIQTSEDRTSGQRQSKDECIDEYEDEMDRKAFEKRRVIKELTPKDRKRSELDDDLIVARAVILEEGVNKDHEREVAEKRKKVVKTTSSTACKKSLLESINSSRAIIMNKSPAQDGDVESASVSFSPLKENKSRIPSAGSGSDSSFHSLDGTKNTNNGNAEESFSMMMIQPVQAMSFEARQATVKQTHEFSLN